MNRAAEEDVEAENLKPLKDKRVLFCEHWLLNMAWGSNFYFHVSIKSKFLCNSLLSVCVCVCVCDQSRLGGWRQSE